MKVSLSVRDRLVMSELYPKKSNLVDQVLVKDITNKIQFTQEEMKEIDFKATANGYTWNDKAPEKEFEFTEAELDLLKKQIEEKDEQKEITLQLTDLCLKLKG